MLNSQAEGDPGNRVIQKYPLAPSILSLSKGLNGTLRIAKRVLISPERSQSKLSGSQTGLCFRITLSTHTHIYIFPVLFLSLGGL